MILFSHTYSHVSRWFSLLHPFCSSKRPLIHSHSLHTNTVIMVNGVEPNQAKWRISAPSVLPGVSAFRDWSNLFLGFTTLPIMTECNQQIVCWRWHPPNRMKMHDNKHNFTSLFCVVLPPLLSLCCLCHYILSPSLPLSDGPGCAVAVGDERRQS